MISELGLKNFKCFQAASLPFGNLTLLSGLNGMGKSSLLQALLLLRQSHQQGLLDETGLALNGELTHVGTSQDALFEGALEEQIEISLKVAEGEQGLWKFSYDQKADVMGLVDKSISSKIYNTCLFNDEFQYLQAERIGPRRYYESSDYHVQQHRHIGTRGEYSIHFLHNFGKDPIPCRALAIESIDSLELKHQVEAWLAMISPGTRIELDSDSNTDIMTIRYAFESGKILSRPYRPTNVGFGISYTLPVIIALLSARKGALILLENPEAHLHPKGQVMIGRLMAKAAECGIQVIAETHSDHVLNGIRMSVHQGGIRPDIVKLHFFERSAAGGSKIISPTIDKNGRIDKWPNGFFDEWDQSLRALVKPGKN